MAAGSEPENVTGKASEAAPEGGRLRVDDWGLLTPDPRPGATVIEEEDGSGRENPLPLRSRGRDADRKPE
jgi:hypothetical protein